jgi:type IV pilus assembly protein PilW
VLGSTALLWDFASATQGFESTGAGTWSPAVDTSIVVSPKSGSDVLAIRTSRLDAPNLTLNASMASATADFTVDPPATGSVPSGAFSAMISDCETATVFWATSYSASTGTIAHAGTNLVIPFGVGSRVVPVDTVIYYIRDSGTLRNGVRNPSLWRRVGNAAPQEMVEGIESMQILYGVDTSGDRLIDDYQKASAVTNWNTVISMTLALLIRSVEPNSIAPDGRTYPMLDTTLGPFNDRYQRTLYTTTVTLRNTTQ